MISKLEPRHLEFAQCLISSFCPTKHMFMFTKVYIPELAEELAQSVKYFVWLPYYQMDNNVITHSKNLKYREFLLYPKYEERVTRICQIIQKINDSSFNSYHKNYDNNLRECIDCINLYIQQNIFSSFLSIIDLLHLKFPNLVVENISRYTFTPNETSLLPNSDL